MDIEKFNRLASKSRKSGLIKECFHHDKNSCNGKIKQAHSIQCNGRISILEYEVNKNKCVYSFDQFKSDEKYSISELIPIGKKKASTFFGFCDHHDSKIFSPIENFEIDLESDEHLFLNSYRSFAHSYHRKKEELKHWNKYDELGFPESYSGSFLKYQMEYGNKIALKELEKKKKILDKIIEQKSYSTLEYFTYEKSGLYPFAVSSQMSPKVSYSNKSINNHSDIKIPYENLMITFLPDKNSTKVIITCFPNDKKAIQLLDELEKLNDLKLEKAITSLIIANCENVILSPVFWNNLSKNRKRDLLDELIINNTDKYREKWFNSSFNFFDNKYDIQNH